MRAPLPLALAVLLLAGCGADAEVSAPASGTPSPSGPDLSTNAAVCKHLAFTTSRAQLDTRLLWGQVNTGTALEEVLAVGWQPGVYDTEADGDALKAEQLYATLPVAAEIVEARPGIDTVSIAFLGTNLELSRKTVYVLPGGVVAAYEDTPEGRNDVQAALEVLDELPELAGPEGLEKVDIDGNLIEQC